MDSQTTLTELKFSGAQTLGGDGVIDMGESGLSQIVGNGGKLTIGAGQTIRGAGQLSDNNMSFDNMGTILARGVEQLVVDTNSTGFDQNGVLKAEGEGGLRLFGSSFRFNNAVEVGADSKLLIELSTIAGTIDVATGGEASIVDSNVQGVTVNGDINQTDTTNTIRLGLTNNGVWSLQSVAETAQLMFSGEQTLDGDGEIALGENGLSRIDGNGGKLTIGVGQTIRGAGMLSDNNMSFNNLGTIVAQGDEQLVIDTNSTGFDQNGVLKAEGVGGLLVFGTSLRLNNPVEVENGSKLHIQSASVEGSIDVNAGGLAEIEGSTLRGLVVSGDVTQPEAVTNTISSGLTNNGSWTLASQNEASVMRFTGSQSLDGAGEVVLGDSGLSKLEGNGGLLTIGAMQTISGSGELGVNSLSVLNRGEVHASSELNSLRIDANANRFTNEGTVRASGAGGLVSIGDLVQTAGQTIVDSTLTLQGGELDMRGGSLSGSGRVIGDVKLSGGVVNPGNSPGVLTIDGNFEQELGGELLIEIGGGAHGEFDQLVVEGTAELDGMLSVMLLGRPRIDVGDTFDVLIANLIAGEFEVMQVQAGLAIFDIEILDGVQDVVRLTAIQASPVPLPAAAWLLLCALGSLAPGGA